MPGAAPAGYTGLMSIGGAEFTLAVGMTQFDLGLTAAQKKAEAAAAHIDRDFAKVADSARTHGRGAAMGILELSRAIDDAQYGFRAVVNNIPQIVYMMGGTAGIAGAAGIAAVAVNLLVNHWDDLARLWGDSAANELPKIKEGLEGLRDTLKEVEAEIAKLQRTGKEGPNLFEIATGSGIEGQNKLRRLQQMKEEVTEEQKIQRDLEATGPEHTEERQAIGAAVRKAIAKMPEGSDTLEKRLIMEGGMEKKEAEKAISEATRGHAGYLQDILKATAGMKGPGMEELRKASPEGMAEASDEKLQEENIKKRAELDRILRDRAAHDEGERLKNLDEARDKRVQALQDKAEAIHDEKAALRDKFRADKDMMGRGSEILSGSKAVVDMYQKAAADQPLLEIQRRQEQLMKDQDVKLREIRDEIKKERRLVLNK
jgi:hypothetical protein